MEVNNLVIAAHELKAPLSLMRQLALSLDFAEDGREKQQIQAEMVDLSERTMRQVNDLTKIPKLEEGLFEMEPVSVRAVCDAVTAELDSLFRFNQRELVVQYRNRARLAIANRDLLFSVIYNFCLNAMHYSGEETLSKLTVRQWKDTIQVRVRDFGPALPTKIWRKFSRGEMDDMAGIPMRPGSSGLGLFIASKFAHYMNAEVGATRHKDGTSFFVNLPISKQASLLDDFDY